MKHLKDFFVLLLIPVFAAGISFFSLKALFFAERVKQKKKNHQVAKLRNRSLASISSSQISFLSKEELKVLSYKRLRLYLKLTSKVLVKSKLAYHSKTKLSPLLFLVEEAYASVTCPMQGLHPYKKKRQADCDKVPFAIFVEEPSTSNFEQSRVFKDKNSGKLLLTCPSPLNMCNPALVGFKFDSGGAAQLRCLKDASNANCAALPTRGEDLKKSLELLDEANPNYWEEFAFGVNELCMEQGEFKLKDSSCRFVRDKMNTLTGKFRASLPRKYRKLSEGLSHNLTDSHACRGKVLEKSNYDQFNEPGQKIFYIQGQGCYRLPSDAQLEIKNNFYYFYRIQSDGSREELSGDFRIPFLNVSDRTELHHYKCGACNQAEQIELCLSELEKPASERNIPEYKEIDYKRIYGQLKCNRFLQSLRSAYVTDTLKEKMDEDYNYFWQAESIQ